MTVKQGPREVPEPTEAGEVQEPGEFRETQEAEELLATPRTQTPLLSVTIRQVLLPATLDIPPQQTVRTPPTPRVSQRLTSQVTQLCRATRAVTRISSQVSHRCTSEGILRLSMRVTHLRQAMAVTPSQVSQRLTTQVTRDTATLPSASRHITLPTHRHISKATSITLTAHPMAHTHRVITINSSPATQET